MKTYPNSIDRMKRQNCDRGAQKVLGRDHRKKFHPRRKAIRGTRRTARQLDFKGRKLILWNEDVNIVGRINPRLALKVSTYAWAESDEERAEYKRAFWNNQKGNMKRDFALMADILMEFHGGTLSAQGRPFIDWN